MGKTNSFLERFTIVIPGNAGTGNRHIARAVCLYCYEAAERKEIPRSEVATFQKRISRAYPHLAKCKFALADPAFVEAKKEYDLVAAPSSTPIQTTPLPPTSSAAFETIMKRRTEVDLTGSSTPLPKKQKQTTLDGVQNPGKPNAARIWGYHQRIINYVTAAGISNNVIDCSEFRELLTYGNAQLQAYPDILPYRPAFLTTILGQREEEVRDEIASSVANSKVITLCGDTCTDSSGRSIFIVVSRDEHGEQHIIESTNISKQSRDTEATILRLDNAINNQLVKGRVNAFVTNSASCLVKAKIELSKKYPDILFLPCFSQQINLIRSQLLNAQGNFLEYLKLCSEIVRAVNGSPHRTKRLRALKRGLNEPVLKLLNHHDTRWNSTKDMLDRIIMSRLSLTSLFRELSNSATDFNVKQRFSSIYNTLQYNDFWQCLKQGQAIIPVLTKYQISFQSDSARLHMILPALFDILQHVRYARSPLLNAKQFEQEINQRLQAGTWNTEILLLATFLVPNPAISMESMIRSNICQLTVMVRYCIKYYKMFFKEDPTNLAEEVSKYYNRQNLRNFEPFICLYDGSLGENANTVFWESYAYIVLPELQRLAYHIFSISINSVSVKRLFSDMENIHTVKKKEPSILTPQSVLGLAQIKNSLSTQRKLKMASEEKNKTLRKLERKEREAIWRQKMRADDEDESSGIDDESSDEDESDSDDEFQQLESNNDTDEDEDEDYDDEEEEDESVHGQPSFSNGPGIFDANGTGLVDLTDKFTVDTLFNLPIFQE